MLAQQGNNYSHFNLGEVLGQQRRWRAWWLNGGTS
jgi:hypothetical protein